MPTRARSQKKDIKPNIDIDFSADVGAGMENADADSFAIPFLRVLQTNSPEVDASSGRAVEGAKAGMLYNSVTGDMYDGKKGCQFIPSAYQRRFLRWAPRGSSGQGFRGELLPEQVAELRGAGRIVDHEGRLYYPLDDGTVDRDRCDRIQDTRNHFGCVLDKADVPQKVLLSLTSTQIKKSKLLMALLAGQTREVHGQLVTPPTFLFRVRITTVPESNDQGSWFGVQFDLDGDVDNAAHYAAAREFHRTVSKGDVEVKYEEATPERDEF